MKSFEKEKREQEIFESFFIETDQQKSLDNTNKNMITEDYVSFETSKLLKEKGFDELCSCLYNKKTKERTTPREYVYNGEWEAFILCPTLQMAMKWMREVKHIFIEVLVETAIKGAFTWRLYEYPSLEIMPYDGWENTPEDAAEAAIKYCLENLI